MYVCQPNTGVVSAGASIDVQIIMQAQREAPLDLNAIKDKFLVQSVKLAENEKLSGESFNRSSGKEMQETRLKVIFLPPPAPPSPVPEEPSRSMTAEPRSNGAEKAAVTSNISGDTPAMSRGSAGGAGAGGAGVDTERLLRERDDAVARVRAVEAELAGSKVAVAGVANASGQGFTLIHLLLTAIICFLLGRYT